MIGSALRAEIARYAVEMQRQNPLFTLARDGALTADCVARYLANVHEVVRHTPIYLARARARARALGHDALAAHYAGKLDEEVGHDEWAEQDLALVASQTLRVVDRATLPAIRSLLGYLGELIDEDPTLYLAYILFTEQLVVILGPEWLELLERRCGIPRTSMTVIDRHAELDKEHVEAALDEIDDLVGDPALLPKMREALLRSIAHFDRFCWEVTRMEECDAVPARNVSAA